MTDDLRLPPRRTLPPEVRARLRETIHNGLDERAGGNPGETAGGPRPRRSSHGRGIAAVAAAVVLLVGGVAIAAQVARPSHVARPPGDPALTRCWNAVTAAGRTDDVPAGEAWQLVSTNTKGDDTVVGILADGKPMFCEMTATTVIVSDPNAKPAHAGTSRTDVLLYTTTGLVAGVADASWPLVEVSITDGPGIEAVQPVGASHLFTSFTGTDPASTRLSVGISVPRQVTRAAPPQPVADIPAPLLSIVDRPADLSSPAGQALTQCLALTGPPPGGAESYQPGVLLQDGGSSIVVARSAQHALACAVSPDPADSFRAKGTLSVDTFTGRSIPAKRLSVPSVGGKTAFIGITPPDAASMVADFLTGTAVPITVANGTFGTWLPDGAKPTDPQSGETWVRVETAEGVIEFNGYVAFT